MNIKFSVDPNLPKEMLLLEIQTSAKEAASKNNGARFLGATIAPFSALLVQLAREADEKTQTLIALTHRLIFWARILTCLTSILVLLTFALIIDEGIKLYREFSQISLKHPQERKADEQNQGNAGQTK
jgi:hypothetical protein